jgi:type II secretory pathway component PulF
MSDTFSYKARNQFGKKQSGVIKANSPERAASILAEQNLIPIEIKGIDSLAKPGLFGFMKGKMYESLIIFTRNLSTLYKADPAPLVTFLFLEGLPRSFMVQHLERISHVIG